MLGIGSALYKTPLKRRFGTLGVKQADSSHIPQPAIAGLGFAPNGVNAFSSPQNFDSPFGLPQDDTLTLEALPPLTSIPRFQKQLAVFDVGGMR